MTQPIYIDATILYRWRTMAPVGIIRLERLLASHLRFRSSFESVEFVFWDGGYRAAEPHEVERLDELLSGARPIADDAQHNARVGVAAEPATRNGLARTVRRTGLKLVARVPDHLRPFAEQAAWSVATFGVEASRHVRRTRLERKRTTKPDRPVDRRVRHRADFSRGGDLLALGLGWEYLDHEAMYLLRRDHGLRIHMPAFDLIPVLMPQMNAGQSAMVHQFYAEMAHYADSITCISEATATALEHFYSLEDLPVPFIVTNPLPGFDPDPEPVTPGSARRHRFEGEEFVLTVSTVEVRKNHVLLAKIWAELQREQIDIPRLVIVGRIGWDVDELLRWVEHAPELQDRVTIVSDVEDDELNHLYQDALFTVFPSRIEGWGLPITESMTYGKACIHATDPSQFEASQGLMPAIHPDDFLGWKAELLRMTHDHDYRHGLERAIAERYVRRTPSEYCQQFERILVDRRALA